MSEPDPAPPRKRLTRQESQARTRALLLEVATVEFLAHGYYGTSLERVAEAAGFSKGAVYGNFAGKEELCLAVLETYFFAQLQKFVTEFAAGGETIEERLGVLERWLEVALADEKWQLLALEFATQTRHNQKIQEQLAQRERMMRTAVTALLTQQIRQLGVTPILPPDQLSIVLVSIVGGIAVQRLIDPTIPASLLTDAVRALFRAPRPEGGT
ncbi:MAG TPA: TetR/AcrR family transcriptional regulator [Acidimicrobiia bacterium]|jgi:AcrR family transcriptional regulator|nr:TetR/AcrR family transcriptional regulator [Acidimicrobiia bacterium]